MRHAQSQNWRGLRGFTPLRVIYLSTFIDLTHEKRRTLEIGVITLQHLNISFLTLP